MNCNCSDLILVPPSKEIGNLNMVAEGQWVLLNQCGLCNQLWVQSPLEPYASFVYYLKWSGTIEDWKYSATIEDSSDMHMWFINEIRHLYPKCDVETQGIILRHDERSYFHYNLTNRPSKKKSWFNLKRFFS